MPTYEYKREDGTVFEVIQKIREPPLETCPTTGQKVMRILSGGGGVLYKGDGFYITDYKQNKPKTGEGSVGSNGHKAENSELKKAPASEET